MPEPIDITQGRRLLDAATPGPFVVSDDNGVFAHMQSLYQLEKDGWRERVASNMRTADAELIVWARNNLPALLDALDDAECESERLRGDWIIENRQRKAVEAALARAQQAYAAVARIRHLHQQYLPVAVDYDCCSHCNVGGSYVEWPCPTIRPLDGDQ